MAMYAIYGSLCTLTCILDGLMQAFKKQYTVYHSEYVDCHRVNCFSLCAHGI